MRDGRVGGGTVTEAIRTWGLRSFADPHVMADQTGGTQGQCDWQPASGTSIACVPARVFESTKPTRACVSGHNCIQIDRVRDVIALVPLPRDGDWPHAKKQT